MQKRFIHLAMSLFLAFAFCAATASTASAISSDDFWSGLSIPEITIDATIQPKVDTGLGTAQPIEMPPAVTIDASIETRVEPISSDWAKPELERAEELGLIPVVLIGKDLTKPITRAEFAAVSVKLYENLSATAALPALTNPFKDTSEIEVLKAYNLGVTAGTAADLFSPEVLLNREQAAAMLARVFKRVTMPGWTLAADDQFPLSDEARETFADDDKINGWAKDSVYFMSSNGIILGVGGNLFAPRATTSDEEARGYAQATREQALAIAVRMVEKLGN